MFKKITIAVALFFMFSLVSLGHMIAAPPYQAPEGESYTVEAGDNLSKLALRFYGNRQSWWRIVAATNEKAQSDPAYQTINDPNLILIGQKLWIPATEPDTAQVTAIVTPSGLSNNQGTSSTIEVLSKAKAITPFAANFSEGLAPFAMGSQYGYIDQAGNLKIPTRFETADLFQQGLAAVSINKQFGYIDQNGAFVIRPQLRGVVPTMADLAGHGEWVTPTIISAITTIDPFTDTTGLVGYRESPSNEIVIEPQFEAGTPFSENLAAVVVNDQVGYIDTTGTLIIQPTFEGGGFFSEGLAAVVVADKLGYIDETGAGVIEPIFDEAGPFVFGLACVIIDQIPGIINREGTFIPELYIDYESSDNRCNPNAADYGDRPIVSDFSGTLYGYQDETGKIAISPQFQAADRFSEGLAQVKVNNRYGYINATGNIIIAPQYDEATAFSGGVALVHNEAGYKVIASDGTTVVVGPEAIRQVNYNDHDPLDIQGVFEGECNPSSAIIPDGYTCTATNVLTDTALASVGQTFDSCLLTASDAFFCLLDFHNIGVEIRRPANANVWALWGAGFGPPSTAPPWRIMVTDHIQCARRASTATEGANNQLTYHCEDGEWILGEIQPQNESVWLVNKGNVVAVDADNPTLISPIIVAVLEIWTEWIPSFTLIPEESEPSTITSLPTQPPPAWQMRYRRQIYRTHRFIRPGRFR